MSGIIGSPNWKRLGRIIFWPRGSRSGQATIGERSWFFAAAWAQSLLSGDLLSVKYALK